jgi:hypothetical protein
MTILIRLAFLPPEPTYSLELLDSLVNTTDEPNLSPKATPTSDLSSTVRYKIIFTDKAEWQHSANDLSKLEAYFVRTSRHQRVACLHITCTPNPKYYILFSHGNAVDLGRYMLLFFFLASSFSSSFSFHC